MSKRQVNLTGAWTGDYAYPGHSAPTTPFLATIEERDGRLTGTIIEPDFLDGTTLQADMSGHRHGSAVDFTKIYGPGTPDDYDTPVDYVGRLSDDGAMISGVWSLLDMDGTFEMHRDIALEEPIEEQEQIALPSRA